jgi:hypothetical protein
MLFSVYSAVKSPVFSSTFGYFPNFGPFCGSLSAAAAADIYHFICDKMVDPRPGSEWFWQTDENGVPAQKPIVEPWKCPYHNGRMCLELMRRDPDVQV